jgi:hypothetical protein
MKKLRLTPLNIVTALALAFFILLLFQPKPKVASHADVSPFFMFLSGALVVVAFVSDLIFRFTLKDLKRIWIVETIFIALAIALYLILQK